MQEWWCYARGYRNCKICGMPLRARRSAPAGFQPKRCIVHDTRRPCSTWPFAVLCSIRRVFVRILARKALSNLVVDLRPLCGALCDSFVCCDPPESQALNTYTCASILYISHGRAPALHLPCYCSRFATLFLPPPIADSAHSARYAHQAKSRPQSLRATAGHCPSHPANRHTNRIRRNHLSRRCAPALAHALRLYTNGTKHHRLIAIPSSKMHVFHTRRSTV